MAPSAGRKSDSQGGTEQQYCLELQIGPESFPVVRPNFSLLTQEIHSARWGRSHYECRKSSHLNNNEKKDTEKETAAIALYNFFFLSK